MEYSKHERYYHMGLLLSKKFECNDCNEVLDLDNAILCIEVQCSRRFRCDKCIDKNHNNHKIRRMGVYSTLDKTIKYIFESCNAEYNKCFTAYMTFFHMHEAVYKEIFQEQYNEINQNFIDEFNYIFKLFDSLKDVNENKLRDEFDREGSFSLKIPKSKMTYTDKRGIKAILPKTWDEFKPLKIEELKSLLHDVYTNCYKIQQNIDIMLVKYIIHLMNKEENTDAMKVIYNNYCKLRPSMYGNKDIDNFLKEQYDCEEKINKMKSESELSEQFEYDMIVFKGTKELADLKEIISIFNPSLLTETTCEFCSEYFDTKLQLCTHYKSVHPTEYELFFYNCTICNLSFATVSDLNVHVLHHD